MQGGPQKMKYVERREEPKEKMRSAYKAAMAVGHKPSGQSMQTMVMAGLGGPKKVKPDYGIGDTVAHIKFGTGVVQNIMDGGRDYEITVEFEAYGTKKMFAGFAKLKKL